MGIAAIFLVPAILGVLMLAAGRRLERLQWGLLVLGNLVPFGLSIWFLYLTAFKGGVFYGWGEELLVDALSALMFFLISTIGLCGAVFSPRYLEHWVGGDPQRRARLPTYTGFYLLFVATMLWACSTNNIVMLWVAVEATTIASALLVSFYWNRRALEAGYKYLLLLTVGISFALFGCVLLYSASTAHLPGGKAMLITHIRTIVGLIPKSVAVMVLAFLIIGFGTKAGLAPFHPWLPDAHAEAPSPISALLSGVMIEVAAYALFRTVLPFFPYYPHVGPFLMVLGSISLILGIALAFLQDDLKRMLAYSSVSEMGLIVLGLGIGSFLGIYGGLYHLLNHGILKALLFLCAGAVLYSTGLRRVEGVGGLGHFLPVVAVCFMIGAFGLGGIPPLNGFFSLLTVFLAAGNAGHWWAAGVAMTADILTLACFVHVGMRLFMSPARGALKLDDVKRTPISLAVPLLFLGFLSFLFGVGYPIYHPILGSATRALLP